MIVEIDGPISYVEHSGPPDAPRVVYLHGLGGSLSNWNDLALRMRAHVRGTALDLPGFGRSPSAGRRTTVTANANLVGRFLKTVVGEPAILVGTSMGALISILLAATEPDLVPALALIAPPWPLTGPPRVHRDVGRSALVSGIPGLGELILARRLATVPAHQRVEQTLRRCCADPTRVSATMRQATIADEELVTQEGFRRARDYLCAARSIVRTLAQRHTHTRRVADLPQPVLLMHGTADRLVPVAAARAASNLLRHGTYREVAAGHIAHMETPDDIAAALLAWLATVTPQHRPEFNGMQ
ncbi:alpha/beta fold hydrolase [Hamadaea tsunoensis]|uniref:alpha/beta fold hydrolase n=1 Tax=Hamadaea tsunoensis TaxID=53368 RepID=UPI0003F76B1F|nr:alpha/beta fold hydrolase [Hamadaea tsunoensis]